MIRKTIGAIGAVLAVLAVLAGLAPPAPVVAERDDRVETQIVGGRVVGNASDFPFMAAIDNVRYPSPYYCGGSLISPRFVMTAAHCVVDYETGDYASPDLFVVAVGQLNLQDVPEKDWLPVARVLPHPEYQAFGEDGRYDVALLELRRPVKGASVVGLPEPGNRTVGRAGDRLTALGWGARYSAGPASARLRQVDMRVVDPGECRAKYPRAGLPFSPALQVCANAVGKSTCQGDSGGPLVTSRDGRMVQVGIVSLGVGCATTGWPEVETRVSNPEILDWIRQTARLG